MIYANVNVTVNARIYYYDGENTIICDEYESLNGDLEEITIGDKNTPMTYYIENGICGNITVNGNVTSSSTHGTIVYTYSDREDGVYTDTVPT